MMYNYGPGAGIGFFGLILMIVFWAILVWLIVILLRSIFHTNKDRWIHDYKNCHWHDHDVQKTESPILEKNTPLDILKERYAGGDISKAEFEEKKKDIM